MLHYRALLCWDLHSACCIFPFALFIVLEFEQIISMQGISDLFEHSMQNQALTIINLNSKGMSEPQEHCHFLYQPGIHLK